MEIDFSAARGALEFPEFKRQATVAKPFPVPHEWTRWMCIDPHPRVPHCMLWMAVSPWDDHCYYREYWPSKAYGIRGDVPEDDEIFQIDAYAKTLKFFESEDVDVFGPNGYADNHGRREKVYKRLMDPAGKGFPAVVRDGRKEPVTFWDRYRAEGIVCEEAKKDFQASRDKVGMRLRPCLLADGAGEREQSQIIIFDTCPELILELETNRFPRLTPTQAEKKDPADDPLPKRKHATDCLRYLEAEDPFYVDPGRKVPQAKRIYEEIAY